MINKTYKLVKVRGLIRCTFFFFLEVFLHCTAEQKACYYGHCNRLIHFCDSEWKTWLLQTDLKCDASSFHSNDDFKCNAFVQQMRKQQCLTTTWNYSSAVKKDTDKLYNNKHTVYDSHTYTYISNICIQDKHNTYPQITCC